MMENIPENFKNKYKNSKITQNHCTICPERITPRQDLNLEDMDDLVAYFKIILSEITKKKTT